MARKVADLKRLKKIVKKIKNWMKLSTILKPKKTQKNPTKPSKTQP